MKSPAPCASCNTGRASSRRPRRAACNLTTVIKLSVHIRWALSLDEVTPPELNVRNAQLSWYATEKLPRQVMEANLSIAVVKWGNLSLCT